MVCRASIALSLCVGIAVASSCRSAPAPSDPQLPTRLSRYVPESRHRDVANELRAVEQHRGSARERFELRRALYRSLSEDFASLPLQERVNARVAARAAVYSGDTYWADTAEVWAPPTDETGGQP